MSYPVDQGGVDDSRSFTKTAGLVRGRPFAKGNHPASRRSRSHNKKAQIPDLDLIKQEEQGRGTDAAGFVGLGVSAT